MEMMALAGSTEEPGVVDTTALHATVTWPLVMTPVAFGSVTLAGLTKVRVGAPREFTSVVLLDDDVPPVVPLAPPLAPPEPPWLLPPLPPEPPSLGVPAAPASPAAPALGSKFGLWLLVPQPAVQPTTNPVSKMNRLMTNLSAPKSEMSP